MTQPAPRESAQLLETSTAGELVWDRNNFLSRDDPSGSCPPAIDITGPARFLWFGPYVPLPAGVWRAEVMFDLCEDAARGRFAVQFGCEPDYTTVDLPGRAPGRQCVVLEHRFSDEGLAQVRLWLKRAAFHGEVRFGQVTIAVADDQSATDGA